MFSWENGTKITLLPPALRYASGEVAISTWRIEDGRGDLVFSVWLRQSNPKLTLTCYRGSLDPRDFPEIFTRSFDEADWWQLRPEALRNGTLPSIAEARL